jgi:hypothetical protein
VHDHLHVENRDGHPHPRKKTLGFYEGCMRNSNGFLEGVLDKHLEGFYVEYKTNLHGFGGELH